MRHADDCTATGAEECEPAAGLRWDQPPGSYVVEATDELGDEQPWCQIRARAFELKAEDDLAEADR